MVLFRGNPPTPQNQNIMLYNDGLSPPNPAQFRRSQKYFFYKSFKIDSDWILWRLNVCFFKVSVRFDWAEAHTSIMVHRLFTLMYVCVCVLNLLCVLLHHESWDCTQFHMCFTLNVVCNPLTPSLFLSFRKTNKNKKIKIMEHKWSLCQKVWLPFLWSYPFLRYTTFAYMSKMKFLMKVFLFIFDFAFHLYIALKLSVKKFVNSPSTFSGGVCEIYIIYALPGNLFECVWASVNSSTTNC